MSQLDLFPEPQQEPAVWRAEYARIRAALAADVVGNERTLAELALIGVQHEMGRTMQRAIIVGPSGSAKTTSANALARALSPASGAPLGVPAVVIDAVALAEVNWQGEQLSTRIADLVRAAHVMSALTAGRVPAMFLAERGLVIIDEIDKVGELGHRDNGRSYRRGKQETLLAVFGGGDVRYDAGAPGGGASVWRSRGALVIGAGVFPMLPRDRDPVPRDFRGFMPELVERFGRVLRMEPLDMRHMAVLLTRSIASVERSFHAFGYELRLAPEAAHYVAEAQVAGRGRAGARTAMMWLATAAEAVLVRLLAADAPTGTVATLAPDDLTLGSPARSP